MSELKRNNNQNAPEATGLVCRACGCRHFRVIYLKRMPGSLMRRRECRNCGKRITTRETTR